MFMCCVQKTMFFGCQNCINRLFRFFCSYIAGGLVIFTTITTIFLCKLANYGFPALYGWNPLLVLCVLFCCATSCLCRRTKYERNNDGMFHIVYSFIFLLCLYCFILCLCLYCCVCCLFVLVRCQRVKILYVAGGTQIIQCAVRRHWKLFCPCFVLLTCFIFKAKKVLVQRVLSVFQLKRVENVLFGNQLITKPSS